MRREDRELARDRSVPAKDKGGTQEPQQPSEHDRVESGGTPDEPQKKPSTERHGPLPLPD